MTANIISHDIVSLLDGWIEDERNGVQFPVPLHDYWAIAGHKFKKNAFELVESLLDQGLDFLPLKVNSAVSGIGRSRKGLMLSVAALEHFCMAAHTEQGKNVRELYRQSKAKWDLVKQVAPQVAQEVELIAMKIELAKIEMQKASIEAQSQSFRHLVITTMPEIAQQKILGYQLVEKVEYRDRIIQDNQVLDEGNTVNKTELCDRYNIKTRSGSSDYKRLNALLEGANLPRGAWEEATTIRSNLQLRREYLDNLDRYIIGSTRQLHVGEQ